MFISYLWEQKKGGMLYFTVEFSLLPTYNCITVQNKNKSEQRVHDQWMIKKLTRVGIWIEITNAKFGAAWMAVQYLLLPKYLAVFQPFDLLLYS